MKCPRAKSDMTPCIVKDGDVAYDDTGRCVGCNWKPASKAEVRRLQTHIAAAPSQPVPELKETGVIPLGMKCEVCDGATATHFHTELDLYLCDECANTEEM